MEQPGRIPSWVGTEVRDRDGRPLGTVAGLEFDALTLQPAAFRVLLADRREATLPAAGARLATRHVTLAVAGDALL